MLDKHIQSAKDYADQHREDNKIALVCITWDLTHVWHIDYIDQINNNLVKILWDQPYKLMVGVEADETSVLRKGKAPIYSEEERRIIFQALKGVDYAFISNSEQDWLLPETRPYATTIYIDPDVFISHEEYYPTSTDIFKTVDKLDGRKFLLMWDNKWEGELLRKKFDRSTSGTIKSIINQHT